MKKWRSARVVFLLSILFLSVYPSAFGAETIWPDRNNPIIIDSTDRKVMIYTEVSEKNLHEKNPHWGVVFKDGKYGDKAILKAYSHHLAFHDALVQIGAKPGNNLTKDVLDVPVEGDILQMTATWPGLGKELNLGDMFYDETGKGFEVKFGGNRKASEEMNTGCITCLESCWIAITSNAQYPNISSTKRAISPNSKFMGKADVLPAGGSPVILTYRVVKPVAQHLSPVISTDWLEKNLKIPGLVILDTRKPGDYEDGHIPSAVNIPFDSLAVKKNDLNDELPDDALLVSLLSEAGINAESKVVIVGKADNIAPELGRNTRIAWTLTYAGMKEVAVLDGAYNKWRDENRPVSTATVKPEKTEFKPAWNRDMMVNKNDVMARKNSVTLVDVRPEGFFTGDKKIPLVERFGHIPGAQCILSEHIFMPDKTFKSSEALKELAEKAVGKDKDIEIISYCNTGIMSSVGWFVLNRIAGYTHVRMYDAGLQEWGRDAAAPMEK